MSKFKLLNLILMITFLMGVKTSNLIKNDQNIWITSIKESIQLMEYEFRTSKEKNIFEATNRSNNLRFKLQADKFAVTNRRNEDNWKVEYSLINQNDDNSDFKTIVKKNNLTFESKNIDIIYHNSARGLRQDFLVKRKPKESKNLILNLAVKTPFEFNITPKKITHLKNKKEILSYQDLLVKDAEGKILAASFIKTSKNNFAISVDDTKAKYPILIDPLTTTASWSSEQNQANAYFGYAIAYVGDTDGDGYGDVIVGAPNWDGGQVDEGKVFLYKGSATGLAATAIWSYENNITNSQLGYAVDGAGLINNDTLNDFIVGAPYFTSGQTEEGAVYVFHGKTTSPAATPTTTIQSNVAGAHFGMSVSGGAKFNNDNFADFVVGAPHYQSTFANQGAAFVYHGATAAVNTTPQKTYLGENSNAHFGSTVKVFGDVNNDGYNDLSISSPGFYNDHVDEGAVYIYLGSATGLGATASWIGESNIDNLYFGETMTGGDINKDGKTDLIVGAPRAGGNLTGAVYIYYSNGTTYSATPDLILNGSSAGEYFGGGLATGDLNGDGHFEVVVGSPLYTGTFTNEGRVSIFYGTSFGLTTTPAWTKASVSSEAYFGQSIAIGDVNGDKVNDLHISSVYETNGETYEGKVYSFYGSPRGLNPVPTSIFNITQASSQFGFAVSSAGDVNNDGYDDVIVGAYNYDNGQNNEGTAFVFLGSASGLSTTAAWTFENNVVSAQLGYAVAGNCDVNNDGYGDVIIGANNYKNGQTSEGIAYVFYGSNTGLPATPNWQVESNLASAQYGKAVACAGDTNGDGYDDVLIGAPVFKNTLTAEGKVFLYRGSATGLSTTASWTFVGAQASANAGTAISRAGDVNGDGYSDILIGAPLYDMPLTSEGAVWLFLGSATGPQATPSWTKYGGVASAQLGYSLSDAGKLNNDNYADFVLGAPFYKNTLTGEGAAFIYYGSATGPEATPVMAYGGQANANFGKLVVNGGDADHDGYNEIIVAAPLYDNGQTNEGMIYGFQGTDQGIMTSSIWKYEPNQASSNAGSGIAGNLDINGDSYSDLVIGASTYDITNTNDGAIFVFYGNPP